MGHENSIFEPFDPNQSVQPNSGQDPRDDQSPEELKSAPPIGLELREVQRMSMKPLENRENVSSAHSIVSSADGRPFQRDSLPGEQRPGGDRSRKVSRKNDPQKEAEFLRKIGIGIK
jgi:hypothetical protein